mmetsp:Transcript_16080/g.32175  ORF Transcript_16080/g.32175 Transcript_16080/m.32175 type:complete len:535 (+) Transcript_16080:174-1778(+)
MRTGKSADLVAKVTRYTSEMLSAKMTIVLFFMYRFGHPVVALHRSALFLSQLSSIPVDDPSTPLTPSASISPTRSSLNTRNQMSFSETPQFLERREGSTQLKPAKLNPVDDDVELTSLPHPTFNDSISQLEKLTHESSQHSIDLGTNLWNVDSSDGRDKVLLPNISALDEVSEPQDVDVSQLPVGLPPGLSDLSGAGRLLSRSNRALLPTETSSPLQSESSEPGWGWSKSDTVQKSELAHSELVSSKIETAKSVSEKQEGREPTKSNRSRRAPPAAALNAVKTQKSSKLREKSKVKETSTLKGKGACQGSGQESGSAEKAQDAEVIKALKDLTLEEQTGPKTPATARRKVGSKKEKQPTKRKDLPPPTPTMTKSRDELAAAGVVMEWPRWNEKRRRVCSITIEGNPIALKRPRHVMGGHTYDPNYRDKKMFVAGCADQLPSEPWEGAIALCITFEMPRPKSHFSTAKKTIGALKDNVPVAPCTVPDLDNLIKFVLDAFNERLYRDDKQIVEIAARKTYHSLPGPGRTHVEVALL